MVIEIKRFQKSWNFSIRNHNCPADVYHKIRTASVLLSKNTNFLSTKCFSELKSKTHHNHHIVHVSNGLR